ILKMAAAKPEVVISQLLEKISTPYQRQNPIFKVQQPNGTLANSARCNRKSVFKDGGCQTGSSFISASKQDINAVLTANPPFSGSSNPMELLRIVPGVTGSRLLKMAAAKPEVVISQLLEKISTPFQRLHTIFGVQQPNGTLANSARCNRKSAFKDGGCQTGSTYILASRQDINAVPTANPHFRGPGHQRDKCVYCPT